MNSNQCFRCVSFFLSGQRVPEGNESEANGGFHVQRSEETRIWRGFPLALSVYRLIQIYHAACAYKNMFHTKLPATERYDRLYLYFSTVPVGYLFQVVFLMSICLINHSTASLRRVTSAVGFTFT